MVGFGRKEMGKDNCPQFPATQYVIQADSALLLAHFMVY